MVNKQRVIPKATTDGTTAGPLIDEQSIVVIKETDKYHAVVQDEILSWSRDQEGLAVQAMIYEEDTVTGESYLIAAMRCYVTCVVGKLISLPESLAN
jgi:hypothetical protein